MLGAVLLAVTRTSGRPARSAERRWGVAAALLAVHYRAAAREHAVA